jgi:uncharacterized protein YndB with AHSA1/START domain
MKELKLKVVINKSIADVFEFTTNPDNTHKWIKSVTKEVSTEYPPKIGATYQNFDSKGTMNEYIVTQFIENRLFQLDATHDDYKVRYTYTPVSESETELEYFEWSEDGKLHAPFMQEILDYLKEVMEKSNI